MRMCMYTTHTHKSVLCLMPNIRNVPIKVRDKAGTTTNPTESTQLDSRNKQEMCRVRIITPGLCDCMEENFKRISYKTGGEFSVMFGYQSIYKTPLAFLYKILTLLQNKMEENNLI